MNILRDPPSSIHTRRIDKVGDTQQVLLAQEASGDRIAEMINVYARGVNPMVSVSYDNNSNNAGARSSILQGARPVKLPYKPEVFHPPVFRQEDLMPLSRQPRNWFYALSNPEIPNVVHQMSCPESRSSVWDSSRVLHADAPARIQYNNEAPLTNSDLGAGHSTIHDDMLEADRFYVTQPQPEVWSEVVEGTNRKNVHMDVLHTPVFTGKTLPGAGSERDIIQQSRPRSVHENKLLYQAFSNKSGNKNLADSRGMVESIQTRALQDRLQGQTDTNPSALFFRDAQRIAPEVQKEASNAFLYKEVQTRPTRTSFWKSPVLNPSSAENTRAVQKEVLRKQVVANQHAPHVEKRVHHEALSSGRIDNDRRTSSVQAPKSVPASSTQISDFNNVPLSVHDNTLHTEAYTHKTYLDRHEWIGFKDLQAPRLGPIETSTARDTTATGTNLYGFIQSTDGSSHVSKAPSAGSFDPTPQGVPMTQRAYDHGSEMPVRATRNVQRKASSQYFERFSDPPKWK